MKKLLFSTLCVVLFWGLSTQSWADPHDCMTKAEAEKLAILIEEEYIFDYCDCCASGKAEFYARLLKVKKARVVNCSWDRSQYSVAIEYDWIASFEVNDGRLGKFMLPILDPAFLDVDLSNGIATLNYHFYLDGSKAQRLEKLLSKDSGNGCPGMNRFPTTREMPDLLDEYQKDYTKWYNETKY